tara:strand:+ start:290 stop:751 length:462 start_codon:yes stop_codon:yes gene_type:complete
MVKKLTWAATFFLLFILSYLREIIFTSINAKIMGESTYYQKTIKIEYIADWTSNELSQLKVILTLIFSFLFITTTIVGLRYGLKNSKGAQIAILFYSFIILTSITLILIGYFSSTFQTFYPYLRILLGFVHNPLIFILVTTGIFGSNALASKK